MVISPFASLPVGCRPGRGFYTCRTDDRAGETCSGVQMAAVADKSAQIKAASEVARLNDKNKQLQFKLRHMWEVQ